MKGHNPKLNKSYVLNGLDPLILLQDSDDLDKVFCIISCLKTKSFTKTCKFHVFVVRAETHVLKDWFTSHEYIIQEQDRVCLSHSLGTT